MVIGASLNNDRYSNIAIRKLLKHNIDVEAIGYKNGNINNVIITNNLIKFDNIHTVTLYLNKFRQQDYYNYIISLNPNRVIFNPGTENQEFYKILNKNSIKYMKLVLWFYFLRISTSPKKVIKPLIGNNSYPIL